MADEKKRYPTMPVRQWWAIRTRFQRTLPQEVTASYLATALAMGEDSARTNILPSLRLTGLIDDQGKPTELAVKWRDDKHYKEVCEKIRKKVYPRELLDLAPVEAANRTEVQSWFSNATHLGENAASKMVAFYLLLCKADLSQSVENKPSNIRKTAASSKKKNTGGKKKTTREQSGNDAGMDQNNPNIENGSRTKAQPSLHLNIQIHISPEANVQQIDQIFSSMAKHLKELV